MLRIRSSLLRSKNVVPLRRFSADELRNRIFRRHCLDADGSDLLVGSAEVDARRRIDEGVAGAIDSEGLPVFNASFLAGVDVDLSAVGANHPRFPLRFAEFLDDESHRSVERLARRSSE